jgi:integrase
LPVDKIDTSAVLATLKPIWQDKPETASRVRGRIEAVLNAARAQGYRLGENSAARRGHLDQLLPKRHILARGHHAAMPYIGMPNFVAALRKRQPESTSALAIEFLILTAARSGEVLGAHWNEVHLPNKVWAIPASRMKAGRSHRVPLSERAVEVIKQLSSQAPSEFIFQSS